MCGIFGFIPVDRGAPVPAYLKRVHADLKHRGPDGNGWLVLSNGEPILGAAPRAEVCDAVIGHLRLSIFDTTSAGAQPMVSASGRLAIVFNGEIYNHPELRTEMEYEGAKFRSRSDTEILLEGIERHGLSYVERAIGMYAFALLDLTTGEVTLARDPFGIKPLYVTWNEAGTTFASEPGSLVPILGHAPRLDHQRAFDYLRFGMSDIGSGTMFADIEQVLPASFLFLGSAGGRRKETRYHWRMPAATNEIDSPTEAVRTVRETLTRSVELHMRSDVPIAILLSGGVDSTSIAGLARTLAPDSSINVFSYIADDRSLSEERWVDTAASALRLEVTKVRSSGSPETMATGLTELIRSQGEPFGSLSMYAQQLVFASARGSGVKVMLSGQGADEVFGGYPYFAGARLASMVRSAQFIQATNLLRGTRSSVAYGPKATALRSGQFLVPSSMQHLARKIVKRNLTPAWLQPAWLAANAIRVVDVTQTSRGRSQVQSLIESEILEIGMPHLLRYEDRNSMSSGVESRVPFVSTQTVELIRRIPEKFIVGPNGQPKALLREAMHGIVPASILERTDKVGFGPPDRDWLVKIAPWTTDLLDRGLARFNGVLDERRVRDLATRTATLTGMQIRELWRIVNFVAWGEQFNVEAVDES